jgi:type II secretory pathway pseudopilin PulG
VELDQEFLEASRQRASTGDILTGYLLRRFTLTVTIVCAVLILLCVALFFLWRHATDQADRAGRAEKAARLARDNAESQAAATKTALEDLKSAQTKVSYFSKTVTQNQQITSFTRRKLRPVQPGTSVSGPKTGTGTICCFVKSRDGRTFLLTANQAVALGEPVKGDLVLQPGIADGGKAEQDAVANVVRGLPIDFTGPNRTNGVVAELRPKIDFSNEVVGFGAITGVGELGVAQEVVMVGRTSPLSRGVVVELEVDVVIQFPGPNGGTRPARFQNMVGIRAVGEKKEKPAAGAFSRAGDSGAPVLSTDGKLLGMIFAGSEAPGGEITYALPIGPVLKALDVELVR